MVSGFDLVEDGFLLAHGAGFDALGGCIVKLVRLLCWSRQSFSPPLGQIVTGFGRLVHLGTNLKQAPLEGGDVVADRGLTGGEVGRRGAGTLRSRAHALDFTAD